MVSYHGGCGDATGAVGRSRRSYRRTEDAASRFGGLVGGLAELHVGYFNLTGTGRVVATIFGNGVKLGALAGRRCSAGTCENPALAAIP